MARVPRYGTHDGIKYNPRRTLITFCIVCNEVIFKPTRGKKTCNSTCLTIHNNKLQREERNPINNKNITIEDRRQYQTTYYNNHPELVSPRRERNHATNNYRIRYNIDGKYTIHHILPVSLYPQFLDEDWNMIELSYDLHNKFHGKFGGFGKTKNWNIDWINELVNFIYNEVHNNE